MTLNTILGVVWREDGFAGTDRRNRSVSLKVKLNNHVKLEIYDIKMSFKCIVLEILLMAAAQIMKNRLTMKAKVLRSPESHMEPA